MILVAVIFIVDNRYDQEYGMNGNSHCRYMPLTESFTGEKERGAINIPNRQRCCGADTISSAHPLVFLIRHNQGNVGKLSIAPERIRRGT